MKPKVIGMVSPDGSGKDYFYQRADRLISREAYGFEDCARFAFADQLRAEVSLAVAASNDSWFNKDAGLSTVDFREYFNNREKKEQIRDLLKGWAMMRRNLYGADYWAKKADKILSADYPVSTVLVFTDVSYENEQRRIEELVGRKNVRYVRLNVTAPGYQLPDPSAHSSNWGRANLPVDYTFDNDMETGTMDAIVKDVLGGMLT